MERPAFLTNVLDQLGNIESLVEALFMASGVVADTAQVNALQAVASIALTNIADLSAQVEALHAEVSN
jgi:hypothetical protein